MAVVRKEIPVSPVKMDIEEFTTDNNDGVFDLHDLASAVHAIREKYGNIKLGYDSDGQDVDAHKLTVRKSSCDSSLEVQIT